MNPQISQHSTVTTKQIMGSYSDNLIKSINQSQDIRMIAMTAIDQYVTHYQRAQSTERKDEQEAAITLADVKCMAQ